MDVGYLTALVAGVLALLSPCGALLLPSFFAVTFGASNRLVLHSVVFLAGLTTLLAPLGAGAAFAGSLLTAHRGTLIQVSGWLIIALGLVQIFGGGFDLRRFLPASLQAGASTAARPANAVGVVATLGTGGGVGAVGGAGTEGIASSGPTSPSTQAPTIRASLLSAYLLGAVSAVAGFCTGPILGAILTMAGASGSPLYGALLLSIYGLGMALPLFLIAAVWGRWGQRGRAALRGRAFRIGPLRLHTTSVVTGLVLIGVGILFLATNGLVTVDGVLSAGRAADLEVWLTSRIGAISDVTIIAVVAILALTGWVFWVLRFRRREQESRRRPD